MAHPHAQEEGTKSERSESNFELGPLLSSEQGVHLEARLCNSELLIKNLGHLEIKTSHLVIGKVASQLDVDDHTTVGCVPLGMMINRFSLDTNSLHERRGLLKGCKLKGFLKPVVVIGVLPTGITSAGNNVLNDVLIHVDQFLCAVLVKIGKLNL